MVIIALTSLAPPTPAPRRRPVLSAACFLVSLLNAQTAALADTTQPPSINPRVCIGYNPDSKSWGVPMPDAENRYLCPAHFAVNSVRRYRNNPQTAAEVSFLSTCCPLPAEDILSSEESWEPSSCPPGFIVTGYQPPKEFFNAAIPQQTLLRCTKINLERYALTPSESGIHWGLASHAAYPWKEKKTILRGQIPVALRYGIERLSNVERQLNGCISANFSGLLVAKQTGGCRAFSFSGLIRKDSNQVVPLAPQCDAISDVADPEASCIRFGRRADLERGIR